MIDFEAIYKTHRTWLTSLAYQLLGSYADAEDVVQEVFVAVQQHDVEEVENLRAYLAKSVTNRSLNLLKSARKKREVYVGPWLPEPNVSLPEQDPMELMVQKETISYALLVLLEQFNGVERAVFILREAFEYSYREIAEIVERSEANCRKIYSRLRTKLQQELPRSTAPEPIETELIASFIRASQTGNFEEFMHRITEDAILTMDGGGRVRGALRPIYGRAHILSLLNGLLPRGYFEGELQLVSINGQSGILLQRKDGSVVVICLGYDASQAGITRLYFISNPEKLERISI